ncbi:MAG: double zinc ribbon domain-containing protein [Nitrospirota bacterium]
MLHITDAVKTHKSFIFSLFCLSYLIGIAKPAFAGTSDDLACLGIGGGCMTFVLAILILNIVLLVWVAKDAKARGISSIGWMLVVFFFGLLGLVVYLFARPKGDLEECPNCRNKKLRAMMTCPHCGEASSGNIGNSSPVLPHKFCASCGSKNERDSAFCSECGGSF